MKKVFSLIFCFTLLFSNNIISYAETGTKNDRYKELVSLSGELQKNSFNSPIGELNYEKSKSTMSESDLFNNILLDEENQYQRRAESQLEPLDELMIRIIRDDIQTIIKLQFSRKNYMKKMMNIFFWFVVFMQQMVV